MNNRTIETSATNPYWGFFCEAFEVVFEEVDKADPVFVKVFNRLIDSFFSDESGWSADFEENNIDEDRFIKAFRQSISRAGLDNVFNVFLNRYAAAPEVVLAFDVEPEYRMIKLERYIKRKTVLLRRELLPVEMHDYQNYKVPWMVWVGVAEKLLLNKEDLTDKDIKRFSAGMTVFKDRLLSDEGASETLDGDLIDIRTAISKFRKDYVIDTRIDDELNEVEFFLERFDLPAEYFTEIVDFICKIEEFYRGNFRKSEKSKRSPKELAPGFTHVFHIFRLAFGGLEVLKHYKTMMPAGAEKFWKQLESSERLLSLAFRIGGHDIPEDEDKIQNRLDINNLLHTLQGFYVRCAGRLFPENAAAWVDKENNALERLNAKIPRAVAEGITPYGVYIKELLKEGDSTDIYIKMCDNLHNMSTRILGNYDEDVANSKFAQKIKNTEPLIEKALEVGFYWFMPMNTLTKIFETNGISLMKNSHAWRTVYTEIYLPRGGINVAPIGI